MSGASGSRGIRSSTRDGGCDGKPHILLPNLWRTGCNDSGPERALHEVWKGGDATGEFEVCPAGGGIAMGSHGAAFPLPALRRGTPAIVVALLLNFFFPIGLFLLWTHPVWTDKQKWKYTIVWLSAYMGLILLGVMIFLAAGLMSANL